QNQNAGAQGGSRDAHAKSPRVDAANELGAARSTGTAQIALNVVWAASILCTVVDPHMPTIATFDCNSRPWQKPVLCPGARRGKCRVWGGILMIIEGDTN